MSAVLDLSQEFAQLNPEQRQAVEALDGPVLVVAGPGTGKTQLLSLRVANILKERDVRPGNILCLTFTNAGVDAMVKRLAGFLGSAAYEVPVSTFHGFATSLRDHYPQYFNRGALDRPITNLQSKILLNRLLQELPVTSPLYEKPQNGVAGNLGGIQTFIGTFKKSGLKAAEFRAIIQQNMAFFAYIENNTNLLALIETGAPRKKAEKVAFLDSFKATVQEAIDALPGELTKSVVSLPGTYVPYARFFADAFIKREYYDEETANLTGFKDLRGEFFARDHLKRYAFKDRTVGERLLSAIDVCEEYQSYLEQNALFDYEDMVLDAIAAIEQHDELRYALQERYEYVIVDEFQDTNGAQMRILDLLTSQSRRPNILAVGDDDQAIMRFQGASVEYLNQFEEHYDDVVRIVLKTNYRSTPSLVGLGQAIAQQIENRAPASVTEKKLTASRREQEPAHFCARGYANQDIQYYEVAKDIKARIDDGFIRNSKKPAEAIAVIAPKHKGLQQLIPYLKAAGVDYGYRNSASVSKIASLQTLLVLMRFVAAYAAGRTGVADACLPQVLASRELGFEPRTYFSFALDVKSAHTSWFEALGAHTNPRLNALHARLLRISQQAVGGPVRQVIHELCEPIRRYYQARESSDPFALIEFNYGLRALLDFVEGELDTATKVGRAAGPLRLADVMALLDEADRFGADIDVTIPVARPNAITLTTAHSSKGLEYDLVYLLDADDAAWHKQNPTRVCLCGNMLFGTNKDDDDARRLLFVAATRARFELEASFGKSELARELLGQVEAVGVQPPVEDIVAQSEQCWEDDYYPNDPQLLDLLRPHLDNLKMSASLLNSFVEYKKEGADKSAFIMGRILGLPQPPSENLEFGSIVHAFMEDYVNKVVKAQTATVGQLLEAYTRQISWLDFEQTTIEHLHQRLKAIVEKFLPAFGVGIPPSAQAEQWVSAHFDEIPLTGKCDLLIFDAETASIKIYDYKTGNPPNNATPGEDYMRQLRFYKLLIESSPEHAGWKVQGGADVFVEPSKNHGDALVDPHFFTVSEADLEHLRLLIQAVWHRIQNNLFDTSGFLESTHLKAVRAGCVYKSASGTHKAGDPKEPSAKELQPAYEQWLIDEYLQQVCE